MRAAIVAVLLALLIVFAGCASPQDGQEEGGDPGQVESPTTADNEAGAEPVAPPNETNNESGATVEPEDGAGADDGGANESGANETGANESGANETDEATEETNRVVAAALQSAAVGHATVFG